MPKILNENTFADILITKLLERAGEPLLPLLPLLPDRFLVPESDWTMQHTSSPQALASAFAPYFDKPHPIRQNYHLEGKSSKVGRAEMGRPDAVKLQH